MTFFHQSLIQNDHKSIYWGHWELYQPLTVKKTIGCCQRRKTKFKCLRREWNTLNCYHWILRILYTSACYISRESGSRFRDKKCFGPIPRFQMTDFADNISIDFFKYKRAPGIICSGDSGSNLAFYVYFSAQFSNIT